MTLNSRNSFAGSPAWKNFCARPSVWARPRDFILRARMSARRCRPAAGFGSSGGSEMISARFHGWSPIRFYWRDEQPMVDWCRTDDIRFKDSFFEQTITRAMRDPFRVLFRHQTPVETLGEIEAESPASAPTGFIYHMSRCGSTLVSQILAALPDRVVIFGA